MDNNQFNNNNQPVMNNESKKKGNSRLTILLLILVLGMASYIGYDKFYLGKQNSNNNESKEVEDNNKENNDKSLITSNTYNASDYISIKDIELNDRNNSTRKEITFKNLPTDEVSNFEKIINGFPTNFWTRKHIGYEGPNFSESSSYMFAFSSTAEYDTYHNILSVYMTQTGSSDKYCSTGDCIGWKIIDRYSININLDTKKEITTNELLNGLNINKKDVYNKILNSIVDEYFGENQYRQITVGNNSMSTSEFKSNISKYVDSLLNVDDLFILYINNNKLNVVYDAGDVLHACGVCINDTGTGGTCSLPDMPYIVTIEL